MKQPSEWLTAVGEAVMHAAFVGGNPPGSEVEKVIKAIQDDARKDFLPEKSEVPPGECGGLPVPLP